MADGWLKLSFDSPKLDALREQLAAKATRLHEVLSVKLAAITQMLASKIVSEKLSGQVLHRRTGILAGSVHAEPVSDDGTVIRGSVVSSQGPSFYGKFHEFGVSHAWEIVATKRKALAFQLGVKENARTIFAAHVTHPPLPQRSFMRSTLQESEQEIRETLAQSVADVLLGKK
jgi:hypothetical protein